MLPKKYRLTKDRDFKKILSRGKSFFSPSFRLRYLANNADFSRFAVIVSAKISKKATIRNRLKRQVREIIRSVRPRFKDGHDVLIYLRSQALQKKYQQLTEEFLASLAKIGLLKK